MKDTRYNAFWRRTGAALLDTVVLVPICIVATLVVPILGCLAGLGYMIAMHATQGQTLGKMACGIILLRADDERRFGWGRALWRELGPQLVLFGMMMAAMIAFLVSARPAPEDEEASLAAVGWIIAGVSLTWVVANIATMAFNHRRRTLVDLLGGTVVMKASYYEAPTSRTSAGYDAGVPHATSLSYPGGLEPPHHAPEFR